VVGRRKEKVKRAKREIEVEEGGGGEANTPEFFCFPGSSHTIAN
jgi:hypothetical protein